MSRQNIIIEQNFDDRTLPLTVQFAGLLSEELAKSKLMELANFKTGMKISSGSIIFAKAGADEDLEAIYGDFGATEANNVSNIYDEIEIPFVIEASTKGIRVSPEEWIQTMEKGGMDEQALRVKAQKVAKVISRVVMTLWFEGKCPNPKGGTDLILGDGAIPVINFEFREALTDREKVAKEFDTFVYTVFAPQLEKIRNIGFKDPITGMNATDPYRTGVDVNSSIYSLATSNNIKSRWEIWSAHYNRVNTPIEQGSYGSILGFPLYEDIYLPFVGAKIGDLWVNKKKYMHQTQALTYTEGSRRIEFVAIKSDRLVKGVVLDYMWDEKIPKSKASVLGWNMRFGAGSKFVDEIFAIDTLPKTSTALNTVITTTTLGEFPSAPNEATITAKVKELNTAGANATFTVGSITGTGATLTGTGSYTGTVAVTFTVAEGYAVETKEQKKAREKAEKEAFDLEIQTRVEKQLAKSQSEKDLIIKELEKKLTDIQAQVEKQGNE